MEHDNGKTAPALRERLWAEPSEVSVSELPHAVRRRTGSKYADLADDIVLRLEKTGPAHALAYPMRDFQSVKSARSSLYDLLKRAFGKQAVLFRIRKDPPTLYVRRGPNYKSTK